MTTVGVMVTRAMPGRAGLVNSVAVSGITVGQLVMIAGLAVVLAAVGWRSVFYWLALAHFVFAGAAAPDYSRRPRGQGPRGGADGHRNVAARGGAHPPILAADR